MVADSEYVGIRCGVGVIGDRSVNVLRNTVDGAAGSASSAGVVAGQVADGAGGVGQSVSNVAGTAMVFRGPRVAQGNPGDTGTSNKVNVLQLSGTVVSDLAVPLPGGGLPVMVDGGVLTQSAGTTMTVAPGTALEAPAGRWT